MARPLNSALLLILVVALVSACSQILMRWGGQQSQRADALGTLQWVLESRWWLIGIVVGWVAGLGWAWALRTVPVALGMPVCTGLAYVLTLAASWVVLREGLRPVQLGGALLILVGILLIVATEPRPGAAPAP